MSFIIDKFEIKYLYSLVFINNLIIRIILKIING